MMMYCFAKKGGRALGVGLTAMILTVSTAMRADADPVVFTEAFTFPDTAPVNQNWYIGTESTLCAPNCLVYSASMLFDLTSTSSPSGNPANVGDYGVSLHDPSLNYLAGPLPLGTVGPSVDAQGFIPGLNLTSAMLTLAIRGLDPEDDSVRVEAFAADGGAILYENVFAGELASTNVTITLDAAALAALATDGTLGIRISSFGPLDGRDFNLESARLDATANVPEPGTLLLLSGGLGIGAVIRRRRALLTSRARI
jgi:hypothetical protein